MAGIIGVGGIGVAGEKIVVVVAAAGGHTVPRTQRRSDGMDWAYFFKMTMVVAWGSNRGGGSSSRSRSRCCDCWWMNFVVGVVGGE